MTTHTLRPRGIVTVGVMILGGTLGCSNFQDRLLAAPDPDVINPATVNSPAAAEAMRVGALSRVRNITAGGEGAWMLGGLLADEWKSGDTFLQRNETDQRIIQDNNAQVQAMMREIFRVRTSAREALATLKQYVPGTPAYQGQMYWAMALSEITLAEAFCNGTPLGDASSGAPEYGPPLTNQQVFQLALAHADSALTLANGTDATSTAIRNAAAVTKARAQLALGQFTSVAATVANVPTNFQNLATFALTSGDNQIWSLNANQKRWVVGDSFDVGGRITNAIPFASAGDPRLKITGNSTASSPAGKSFDGSTSFVAQTSFGRSESTPIVSGLDARLYEAEARLQANDFTGMMTILNGLRASPPNLGTFTPTAMAALPAPADRNAAIDTYFREKAFWVFGRGQRHGDLRRLVRQYGRTQANVFPSGQFFKGGQYGADVNFPVTVDEQNNPAFTGCLDRNP
ncbi:MAG: hypothetical protein IPJ56_06915 [Gemmatimonadetes bacterium]|nr:hypothetical protein [Gemmatimonadota bacterium]